MRNNLSNNIFNLESIDLPLSIIDHCPDAIIITNNIGEIKYVNNRFTELTGYTKKEVLGKKPSILKSGIQDDEFYQSMWDTLKCEGEWSANLWNKRKDGTLFFEHQIIRTLKNEHNETTHYVSYFKDCSDELAQKRNLDYKLNYDDITGVPNKSRLFEELRVRKEANIEFSLIIIKIKDLPVINESYSKESANIFIKKIAGRLSKLGELKNFIARTNEDDFVILTSEKLLDSQVDYTVSLIASNLETPVEVQQTYIRPSIQLGISHFPEHADTIEQLFDYASIALHNKSNTLNFNVFHQQQKNDECFDFLIAQDIKNALINDEFSIHYQPQYNTFNKKIFSAEALIRWFHKGEMLSPAFFLPVAEKYHLMEAIDLYVLEKVFKDIASSRKNNTNIPKISINLAESLIAITELKQLMFKHGISGSDFELEVTEGLTSTLDLSLIEYISELSLIGITSAIDDFGTGFSSLARLKDLPFDKLKIDKQFVDHIVTKDADRQVLKSIIDIGHVLDKIVIIEGVESLEQVNILASLNCHLIQGYYFSRPIPLDQFVHLLQENNDDIYDVSKVD